MPQLEPTYLLPQEMQRGGWLIVNVQRGAHLSPTSRTPAQRIQLSPLDFLCLMFQAEKGKVQGQATVWQ